MLAQSFVKRALFVRQPQSKLTPQLNKMIGEQQHDTGDLINTRSRCKEHVMEESVIDGPCYSQTPDGRPSCLANISAGAISSTSLPGVKNQLNAADFFHHHV